AANQYNHQSRELSTYYPATTRAEAAEVTVERGAEVTGIDIRHAGRAGQTVSGTLTFAAGTEPAQKESGTAWVGLFNRALREIEYELPWVDGTRFVFKGVAAGEYDLLARSYERNAAPAAPLPVTVKGADINGLTLKLTPLGALAGRVVIEQPAAACQKSALAYDEIVLAAQRVEAGTNAESALPLYSFATPDAVGNFKLPMLTPGRYALQFTLPFGWYVKTLERSQPAAARAAAKDFGVPLKSGESLTGLLATLLGSAASLRGVVESKAALPPRLRVHLIPADPTWADEVLRYAEAPVNAGRFAFDNLAPGKYWLLARPLADDESSERATRPVAWDANERAKLRREAEAAKQEISLATCQRAADFKLPYTTPAKAK
ncbi:MAG: hypothetical protein HYR56_28185, partial [Acidobacteria bacterium]|nr:hypothetical protein [Acidobacteriota bacterium]